ncbi:NAD(P)-dependent oxidoreductase [Aquabacter sp. CN5-332]|uniref:NAD-dependent epimerase/dehydratase family protein n=1 Tax=Aquabacter sp. CN5-332 TaxID=3156608 RepID=UPI0032B52B41
MPRTDLSALRDARILVFGGTGFIGAHLVRTLAGAGAQVVSASRSAAPGLAGATAARPGAIRVERCDASDQEQVVRLVGNVRPDLIYHLTSDSRGGRELHLIPDSIRNDLMAAIHVLLAAANTSTRMVMAGSFEEPTGAASEAVPCSPYAAAKWAGCAYARMAAALHGLPVTVLRLMMTYGPGQKDYKVIPYVIRKLHAGEPAQLSSSARLLDWVYVEDVAEVFARAGAAPWAGAQSIDIGSGRLIPLRELLSMIGDMMGRRDLLSFGGAEERPMEREEAADTSAALSAFGWRARTPLEEGLARTIEAYRPALAPPSNAG